MLSITLSIQRDGRGNEPTLHSRPIEGAEFVPLFTESSSEAVDVLVRFNPTLCELIPHAGY